MNAIKRCQTKSNNAAKPPTSNLPSDSKRLTRVTAAATFEIKIAAEHALSVVTSRTGVVAGRKMFLRSRGSHLAPLWQAGNVVMAVSAAKSLASAVLGMTESESKSGRVGRSSRIRFLIVAYVAARDVTSVRLRARSVTRVTLVVRRKSGWNSQRHSAPQRSAMTRAATIVWPRSAPHVLRMIELEVKALFESVRKSFQRRIVPINVRVTDRAHRHVGCGEL
jgi:hypothetical protein